MGGRGRGVIGGEGGRGVIGGEGGRGQLGAGAGVRGGLLCVLYVVLYVCVSGGVVLGVRDGGRFDGCVDWIVGGHWIGSVPARTRTHTTRLKTDLLQQENVRVAPLDVAQGPPNVVALFSVVEPLWEVGGKKDGG